MSRRSIKPLLIAVVVVVAVILLVRAYGAPLMHSLASLHGGRGGGH
jgi:hypothetical protein